MLPLALLTLLAGAALLPSAVTPELDSRYPGWQLATAAPQITSWFSECRFKFAPNLVTGDFDGDGKTGYVLQIQTKGGKQVMIAFMDRGRKFETHILATDPPGPFSYLPRMEKGSKDFDFTTLKPFRHPVDAVDLIYFEKTPLTFMYRKGVFRKMLSPSGEEIEK